MAPSLLAGAAAIDITPRDSQFLFGYPHVRRYSTGVHDPLLSSALFLSDGATPLLLVANDVIYVSRDTARRVRERIERQTGVPAANMMITATHTHSGPMTVDTLSSEADAIVPKADPRYVEQLEDGIVQAATEAYRGARAAEIGLAIADGSCVGGNRHDPAGPSDPEVPVLCVRGRRDRTMVAAMMVCSMHPTVLHEDSTLTSGDFPAMARQYLQQNVLGRDCPVVYHTGPCGNQSPRHVTRANTFAEAQRLGHMLGESVARALASIQYRGDVVLGCRRQLVDLPTRAMLSLEQAQRRLQEAAGKLESLRRSGADPRVVRTAECDWFGAEEGLTLARAAAAGRIQQVVASVLPAEVMLMRIGPWSLVGWPGEIFVDYALMVKSRRRQCYVISMANGELQGYLASQEAVRQQTYEAQNSLFASPQAPMLLVEKTLELLSSGGGG
jgi:hypothetical protein